MRPPTKLLAVIQSTAVNHQAQDRGPERGMMYEAVGGRRCGYTVLTLDSRLLSPCLLPVCTLVHVHTLSCSVFSSPPLFSACGLGRVQKPNAGLQPVSHLTTIPGPHYHCQSHSGAITLNYVLCCVKRLSQKCLPVVCTFLSLSPYWLCLSHTPLSVPSAIKAL